MLIRVSLPFTANPSRKPSGQSRVERTGQDDPPSFKETALRSTIVGASLGTVAGETIGQGALIASGGYLGWRLGQSFGGDPIAGVVGAVVGTGAAYLLERQVPLGGTVGSAAGFLTGGLVGGITGSMIGGVQAIANADFFKKS